MTTSVLILIGATILASASLAACSPFVPITDMSKVAQTDRAAAASVRIYRIGENIPPGGAYIGPVQGYSCRFLLNDPPASTSAAVEQVKYHTLIAGGNAVTDFSCTLNGADAYGTNCWGSVQCAGTAMKVSDSRE
jgi:hypothetical protein